MEKPAYRPDHEVDAALEKVRNLSRGFDEIPAKEIVDAAWKAYRSSREERNKEESHTLFDQLEAANRSLSYRFLQAPQSRAGATLRLLAGALETGFDQSGKFNQWADDQKKLLESAQRDLTLAMNESGEEFRDGGRTSHPLIKMREELEELRSRLEMTLEKNEASSLWSERALVWAKSEPVTSFPALNREAAHGTAAFKAILDSTLFDLASAAKLYAGRAGLEDVVAIAKNALAFCDRPEPARLWAEKLVERLPGDFRWLYNAANLEFLENRYDQAYNSFQRCLDVHKGGWEAFNLREPIEGSIWVIAIDNDKWNGKLYRATLDDLRKISLMRPLTVSLHKLSDLGAPDHVMEQPCLFNPLGTSGTVSVNPAQLSSQRRLYLYGTIPDRWDIPGVPALGLTMALVRRRFEPRLAWNVGRRLASGSVIALLQLPQTPEPEQEKKAQELVETNLKGKLMAAAAAGGSH